MTQQGWLVGTKLFMRPYQVTRLKHRGDRNVQSTLRSWTLIRRSRGTRCSRLPASHVPSTKRSLTFFRI